MLSPREQYKAKYKTTTMLLLDNTHLRGERRKSVKEKNPCISCREREPGCHTRCPDGKEHEERAKQRREQINSEKTKESDYLGGKIHTVERTKRIVGR